MKIKAAVLEEVGRAMPYEQTRPLVVQEVDLEGPQYGEVLVRIVAAGLCHSDLSTINGDRPRPVPMVLGHEASGVVEELGAGVTDLEVGDHVVCVFVPSCGHCAPCQSGRPALCEPGAAANGQGVLLGGGTRLSRNGEPVLHHLGVSCFAEYATVSRHSLVKVDKETPLHIAALIGCAVLTGTGAVFNTGAVHPAGTTAIVGLGGVGLAAVMGAVATGAQTIVAVDRIPEKLKLAAELGATHTVNADDEDALEQIRDTTNGGVESALDFTGSARALEFSFGITRRGGTTVTGGLPNPAARLDLPAVTFTAEERTLKGSYLGSGVPSRDIPKFLGLHKCGKLPIEKLMTDRLKLEDINAGFDRLHAGTEIRQIIDFT
ncbi:MAG: alcohol dehydrogenase catalytic domain-containing protein [Rhodobacteraceae bacterium]|nr:alcohol dehydrogenase catalytic domain-containing protein [Paracoccaceae bacterium]